MGTKDDKINAEIIGGLDIMAEYLALGARFQSESPRASGKVACYALFRDESSPSAWIDVNNGQYGDSNDPSHPKAINIWDVAADLGRFPAWQDARRYYAAKAGVTLPNKHPTASLMFSDWTEGNLTLARMWCMKKSGATLDAILAAGGRIANYPSRVNPSTGEREPGQHKVVALPAWKDGFIEYEPSSWVIWDIMGRKFPVFRGKGKEPGYVKMKSIGSTAGTLMGKYGLERLDNDNVEIVWKTAGPSDMLALWSIIPPESRDTNLVICNASSETGDVPESNAERLRGKKVFVIHDADAAGEAGVAKWASSLMGIASEIRQVRLPYKIEPKGGKDLRDWITNT